MAAKSSKGAAKDALDGFKLSESLNVGGGAVPPLPVHGPEQDPNDGNGGHVEANLGELDAALGSEGGGGATTSSTGVGTAEPSSPTPVPPLASIPSRPRARARRRPQAVKLRTELKLPEDITNRARAMVRPAATGGRRSLGAQFVLEAMVMAVDDVVSGTGVVDVEGVETQEELAERIKAALAAELAGNAELAESAAA